MFREPQAGFRGGHGASGRLNPHYPSVAEIEAELQKLYEQHRIDFRETIDAQGLEWEDEKGSDPWRGLFNYKNAEYRDTAGTLVPETEAKDKQARIWIYQDDNAAMPASNKLKAPVTRIPKLALL